MYLRNIGKYYTEMQWFGFISDKMFIKSKRIIKLKNKRH